MDRIRYLLYGFVLGLFIGIVGAYIHYDKKATEADLKQSEANLALQKEYMKSVEDIEIKYKKEKEKDEAYIKALRTSINNGSVRLSIPTAKSRITTTESGEKRAELDPETANSLISITEDGDRAIRDLNQCVDTYNKVKEIYDGSNK